MFESSGLTKCLSTAGLLRARASCSRELDVQRRAPPELQERGQNFFLCVSFVVVLISCGAWHLGLTLYKLTRGPLMTACLTFVFSGVIQLNAQNQEVVKLGVQGALLADCCEPGQGRLGRVCFSLYMCGR